MKTRLGSSHPAFVAAVLMALGCGGYRPPAYDVPPVLANREEITAAMRAVGAGLEARVVLRLYVDEEGRVGNAKITRRSGVAELDDAALWIGETMRFEPARYEGRPVPAWVEIPVTFDVVKRIADEPRLRNAAAVAALIARDYPDVRGVARFGVKVSIDGSIAEVRERRTSDPDVIKSARELIDQLDFLPAFRGRGEVTAWVELVFEFAGPDSRVFIESPKT